MSDRVPFLAYLCKLSGVRKETAHQASASTEKGYAGVFRFFLDIGTSQMGAAAGEAHAVSNSTLSTLLRSATFRAQYCLRIGRTWSRWSTLGQVFDRKKTKKDCGGTCRPSWKSNDAGWRVKDLSAGSTNPGEDFDWKITAASKL